jgi:hypothetical protein
MSPHKNFTVAEAYAKLGVTPEQVRAVPTITHHLRRLAKAIKVTGVSVPRDPLYYLRASDDPAVRRVLEARDSIPFTCNRLLPWEAFCVKAGVPPIRLVQAMTDVCKVMSKQFATVIAAVNHPAVVEKTVEIALTDEGQKDRETLHKHAGFILPEGGRHQPVNVQVTQNTSAVANADAKVAAVIAPTPETTVRRLANRLNEVRGFPPAREAPALPAASDSPLPQELLARQGIPATLIRSSSDEAEADLEDYERVDRDTA